MSGESKRSRILLVEDTADDVELARRALRRCDLLVAEDGVAALALLNGPEHGPRPDLVLLDLKLPRIGGLEVLSRLRAEPTTCLLPVVVLTTSIEERDVREAYRRGANSYLRKPVNFDEFSEMVRQICSYWLDLNQPPPPTDEPPHG